MPMLSEMPSWAEHLTAIEFDVGKKWTWGELLSFVAADVEEIGQLETDTITIFANDSLNCLYSFLVASCFAVTIRILDEEHGAQKRASKFRGVIARRLESACGAGGEINSPSLGGSSLSGNTNCIVELRTSGSSGAPKPVRISASALRFQGDSVAKALTLTRDDRQLLYMPLNYVYGLSVVLTWLSSKSVLVASKFAVSRASSFFHQLIERKITVFSGVPYTYSLLRKWGVRNLEESGLRFFTQAGGKLKLRERDAIGTLSPGIGLIIMYGQTEFGGRIAQFRPGDNPEQYDCVGEPLEGVRTIIHEPDQHGYGLIYVASPSVCENAGAMLDSICLEGTRYFSTGDYGAYVNGRLHVSGRNKGFVKLGGRRIPSLPLERLIEDAVDGAECFISADDGRQERLIITIFNPTPLPIDSQLSAFRFLLSLAKTDETLTSLLQAVPLKLLVVVGEVPRLANGKTALSKVKQIVEEANNVKDSIHIWL